MSARRGVPSSPYKGLAPFEDIELDALFFFGRERDTEVIAANVLAARFTVLYGPLGVGKSSVLRAGVARRLRDLAPEAAVVTFDSWAGNAATALVDAAAEAVEGERLPPERPLGDALAELADRFGSDVFLVLDQFEELFVYPRAERVAAELAEVVTRPDLRVNVLIALREDALAELDVFTGRLPNVFANYLALDRIDRAAGRAAILEPIARFNELSGEAPVEIEPALVDAVLDEVEIGRFEWRGLGRDDPAPAGHGRIEAPYLQLVMQRLWELERERGSSTLRLATFQALGGAEAILRAHLDEAMQVLEPEQRDVAARIFNQLVTPSGTKIAHEVADLAEYAGVGEAELGPVVASLGRERILRPVDGRFEIFHDVLAEAVLEWRARHEAARALERQRAEAIRRQRRLVTLLAGAVVVLAAMTGLAIYAFTQRSQAREQAALADAEARRARAAALTAEAGALIPVQPAEIDPELGLLLAAEAARLAPSHRAADTLRRALLVSHIRGVLPDRRVTATAFAPDGERIVVGTSGGTARIYGSDRRTALATLDVGSRVTRVAYGADGEIVLTTQEGGPAQTWDAASGAVRAAFGDTPTEASLSPDGSFILTVEPRGARVWDSGSGLLVAPLSQPEAPVEDASFGARGRLVVTFAQDVARVFDARTGEALVVVRQGGDITSAAITPDGEHLITAGENETARYWRIRDGELVHELSGHKGPVTAGVVSPDGTRLVTTSVDGTARLWALPEATLIADLFGHKNSVLGAAFSDDSQSFVTWSADGTARVWDRGRRAARVVLAGPGGAIESAAFDPSGEMVLTVSADGRARLWSSHVDAVLETLARVPGPVTAGTFSEDGGVAALAGSKGIEVLDAADGSSISSFPGRSVRALAVNSHGSFLAASGSGGAWVSEVGRAPIPVGDGVPVTALAFSADGDRLAVGTKDGTAELWSLDGSRIATFGRPGAPVTSVALSPGADSLAAGYRDGTLRVWDLGERQLRYEALEHEEGTPVLSVVFSRDGRQLVTAGADATLRVWSAFSGQGSYALRGHTRAVEDGAFSPNGQWIVSASLRLVGLFDQPSRQRLLFLVGHPGRALAVSFDPGGDRVAAVTADGTLRGYSCEICSDIPGLLDLADRRLAATGRRLTPAQRRLYFGPGG